jgi:hypothetical protein
VADDRRTEGLVTARTVEIVADNGEKIAASVRWTANGVTGLQLDKPLFVDEAEQHRQG